MGISIRLTSAISNAENSDADSVELQRIKEKYKYPIRLMQKFIVDFVKALERDKHYIYATILHSSEEDFRLVRRFDWKLFWAEQSKGTGYEGEILPESYSLKSFHEIRRAFHRYDEFDIFVFSEVFGREKIITLDKVEKLYQRFIRKKCEAALRRDEQLQLTPEIISEYGLTDDDVTIVRKYLNRFNFEARNKIQKEFDTLKCLSFLKK